MIIVTSSFRESVQNVFRPHWNAKPAFSNFSGLKSVFEKLRLRDGLVWTGGLTGEIKLRFCDGLVWTGPFYPFATICYWGPYTKHDINGNDNKQKNSGCARALWFLVHFFAVLCTTTTCEMTKFCVGWRTWTTTANFSHFYLEFNAFVAYSAGASFNTDRHTG